MVNALRNLVFCTVLVALAGCSSIRVESQYSSATDFSELRAYAWSEELSTRSMDTRLQDPRLEAVLLEAADTCLRERGFRKVAPAQAQIILDYHASIDLELQVSTDVVPETQSNPASLFTYKPAGGWSYDSSYGQEEVQEYERGTLLISMISPGTGKTLWLGVAEGEVMRDPSVEARERRLRRAVNKLFAKFPVR